LHFDLKRSRIEDAGDFIGFPELILFVYFKTPEITAGQEFPKRLYVNKAILMFAAVARLSSYRARKITTVELHLGVLGGRACR